MGIMKQIIEKRTVLFLLAVNLVFVAIVAAILPFEYGTGDDRLMAWTASGYLTGHPDFHTLYMNVIFSWLECQLYIWFPNVEWHTWMFLVIHVLSLSAIGYVVLDGKNGKVAKAALLLALYSMGLLFLTHIQFTTTAGMAATAGMMLIVLKRRYVPGVLLFLLGSLVRYPSAMLCGLMTAALYPLAISRLGFDWRQLGALAICAIGAFSLQRFDAFVYQRDPEWKEIYEYDRLRAELHDNSNVWRLYGNFPEGVTEQRFNSWVGIIEYKDVLSEEEIRACLEVIENDTAYHGIRGLKKVKNIRGQLFGLWPWFVVFAVLVVGGVLNCNNGKERVLTVVGALAFPMAMAFVVLNVRMMERAFLCGWLPMALLLTGVVEYRKPKTLPILVAASLLVLLLALLRWPSSHPTNRQRYRDNCGLVRFGERQGGKYFVMDVVSWCEYPFGLRYRFQDEKSKVISLKNISAAMVGNDDYVFMLERKTKEWLVHDMDSLFKLSNESKTVGVDELGSNDTYVLFRLTEATQKSCCSASLGFSTN